MLHADGPALPHLVHAREAIWGQQMRRWQNPLALAYPKAHRTRF